MTLPKGWDNNNNNNSKRQNNNSYSAEQQLQKGEVKRVVGKAMIVLGIFTTIVGFLSTMPNLGILGFIINIIGIILYAIGNREQGRSTSFFGGGFISTGGG